MHWAEVIHYSFKWAIPMVLVSFTSKLGWATFKYFLLVLWNLVKVDHLDFFVILESEKNVGVNLFGLNFQKMAWTSENANCLFLYSWLFAWNTFYYLWPCLVGWMGVLLLCLKYYLPNSVRSLIETPGSSWWNNIVCFIILLVFMWYVVFKPEMLYNQYTGLF